MKQSRTLSLCVAAGALMVSLLPVLAEGAANSGDGPLFYLFQAEPLGHPATEVAARFEYRSGDRVLGTDDVHLRLGRRDSLLVPIPPSVWTWLRGNVPDLEVLVFANGLLLERFDRAALLEYNRVLGYTHADEVAALSGRPGGTHDIECNSPCGGGCSPSQDYDCDGVINSVDNCVDDYNPGQQNCDGDAWGDVCDHTDAVYQPSGPIETCMADKDDHVAYFTFEHHVEQRLVDVSSCNSPDTWNRWVYSDADCYNLSDSFCCQNGIGTSIEQVGDDPDLWCGLLRNQDHCH